MENLLTKVKALLRAKPATVSATISLVLTNLITLGVLDLSPDKAAAIVSLVTFAVMIVANLVAPTTPAPSIEEIDQGVELADDFEEVDSNDS